MYPAHLKYMSGHIWVRIEKGIAIVGITDYLIEEQGHFSYLDLPTVGTDVEQLQEIGFIETDREAITLQSPLSGKVVQINDNLDESTMDLLYDSPYEEGWLFRMKPSDEEELETLMNAEEYENYIESLQDEEPLDEVETSYSPFE